MKGDLVNLRELSEAATPGPWVADDDHPLHRGPTVLANGEFVLGGVFVASTATDSEGKGLADAALIAATRNALPYLLDVAELAERAIEEWDYRLGLEKAVKRLRGHLQGTEEPA